MKNSATMSIGVMWAVVWYLHTHAETDDHVVGIDVDLWGYLESEGFSPESVGAFKIDASIPERCCGFHASRMECFVSKAKLDAKTLHRVCIEDNWLTGKDHWLYEVI